MKIFNRMLLVLLMINLAFLYVPGTAQSQDDSESENDGVISGGTESEARLSDEELSALLTRVDRFLVDQGMADLTVEVDIYRDPSNRLNDQNIRTGDPSNIAGLSTIVSHYSYTYPDFFQLKIMGDVLAGSEVPADRTFFSQLLPMPGAPIFTGEIRDRFLIRYDGTDEVNDIPVYRVRYSALDRETEFFDYIIYFIDMERSVILRVESSFDNGWYIGSGQGDFYYDEWLGKYLPIYGHGAVFFQPNRNFNIWGRWYSWDWQSEDEAGEGEVEGQ